MIQRTKARLAASEDSGFTLIELLVVIVILGILSGIAIFAVSAFQSDATTACTDANARIKSAASAAAGVSDKDAGSYTSSGADCDNDGKEDS
jgi:prepilin-type N-terminal cleavage/methylation domain-containing protein